MSLFRRASEFQVTGLPGPFHGPDGKVIDPTLTSDRLELQVGDVTVIVKLSADKKTLEVDYEPKKGKRAHDHQVTTGSDGIKMRIAL